MVMSGLMLPELTFIAVSSTANAAYERLLTRVDANMSDVTFTAEKPFGASGAFIRKIPGMSTRMTIQLASVTETLVAHVALERSFT